MRFVALNDRAHQGFHQRVALHERHGLWRVRLLAQFWTEVAELEQASLIPARHLGPPRPHRQSLGNLELDVELPSTSLMPQGVEQM